MDAIRPRAHSSPELTPPSIEHETHDQHDDHSLEGIATNVMLLLKLIQDHNEACAKTDDDRKRQRLAGMISILDDVKSRMQKSQGGNGERRMPEFRRCNTELKLRMPLPRDKKTSEAGGIVIGDEVEQLRKDLNASLAARKSLEMMCSSLGREREFMSAELSKKVHELTELEELVEDLKAQNESLSDKVRACVAEHKERRNNSGGEALDHAFLQERNKELSEQLLKSLDGYRAMKKKYKDTHEKAVHLRKTMDELEDDIGHGQACIDRLRHLVEVKNGKSSRMLDDLDALKVMFGNLGSKLLDCRNQRTETDCKG